MVKLLFNISHTISNFVHDSEHYKNSPIPGLFLVGIIEFWN